MIQLGLLGANGKMGGLVRQRLADNKGDVQLAYSPDRKSFPSTVPPLSAGASEVILDYSSPEFLLANLKHFESIGRKARWLIGSTGWTAEQSRSLEKFKDQQVLLKAANFSIGVLLLRKALRAIETDLKTAGFTAKMKEVHHTRKKDAPSGTALLLREVLPAHGEFPIDSVREGDVVGYHEVTFETAQEKLSFSHDAKDRALFADGALFCVQRIARWPLQKTGLIHTLEDLL